jgi:hypothetical protein
MKLKKISRKLDLAEIIYYFGGTIIFLGLLTLISQNWASFNFLLKITFTLVLGVILHSLGLILKKFSITKSISPAFFLISALIIPIGFYILADNYGFDTTRAGVQSLIMGVLLLIYFFLYKIVSEKIFLVFAIIFGTCFLLSFSKYALPETWQPSLSRFYEYVVLIIGFIYLLLAQLISKTKHSFISGYLYTFGALAILSSALLLGEGRAYKRLFWDWSYIVFIFGAVFLSAYTKRRSIFVLAVIFLTIYILKITSEYFVKSLGWPVALVLAGMLIIAVTFSCIFLKGKYLKS